MKNKKRIAALIAAMAIATVSTVSMSGSAVKPLRDASGDGIIYLNDALVTISYLNGAYNPTNIKSFDFDGNGIISAMDTAKIQQYLLHNISEDGLPGPAGADSQAVATTRTYMRHYYNSSNPASYTEYSLTVDPYDNTASTNNNAAPRAVIGDNDMIRDYDTAVVNLSIGGSGFIVSDHVIATAAHCVFDYSSKEFFDNQIKIIDENNNTISLTPTYTDISKLYNTNNYNTRYDYALLYVEEDLSEYGRLQLGVATDDYINNHGDVIVSGFPQEYPDNYKGQPYRIRFKAKGRIFDSNEIAPHNYNPENIYYNADTAGGDSGGPVYAEEGFTTNGGQLYDYKTVVGINVAHFKDESSNIGIKITPDILKFYMNNSNIEY